MEEREMTVRVGINGFGRMGRLALRAGWNCPEIEFVHINEPAGPVEAAAHLLEFDSVHGRWRHEIGTSDGRLLVDGKAIGYSSSRESTSFSKPAASGGRSGNCRPTWRRG
jgi:glyceraldehyde 3-phosphate dehydrogenase